MAFPVDWCERKSHVVNQQVGAGTNYQVAIKVYFGVGVDGTEVIGGFTAGKIYCNGLCRADFGDIRFTDSLGNLIDCWMESKINSDYALYWIEVPDDLDLANATIYIYYNNPVATYPYLATDLLQGQGTFLFFDDFEDGAIGVWWQKLAGGAYVEAGGILTVGDGAHTSVICSTTKFDNHRMRCSAMHPSANPAQSQIGGKSALTGSLDHNLFWRQTGGRYSDTRENSLSGARQGCAWDMDVYKIYEYVWIRSIQTDFWYDNGTIHNMHNTRIPNEPLYSPHIISTVAQYPIVRLQWCFVSKFTATEPVHGAWGLEEDLCPEPECEDYDNQIDCENAGCYWCFIDGIWQCVGTPCPTPPPPPPEECTQWSHRVCESRIRRRRPDRSGNHPRMHR